MYYETFIFLNHKTQTHVDHRLYLIIGVILIALGIRLFKYKIINT